jgi:hypothetical protein
MLVTKLGRESGSMTREMATLGYFLKIATMAVHCQHGGLRWDPIVVYSRSIYSLL